MLRCLRGVGFFWCNDVRSSFSLLLIHTLFMVPGVLWKETRVQSVGKGWMTRANNV